MSALKHYEELTQKLRSTSDLVSKRNLLKEIYQLIDTFSDDEKLVAFPDTKRSLTLNEKSLQSKIVVAGFPSLDEFYLGKLVAN